jgi:hypothetical protein
MAAYQTLDLFDEKQRLRAQRPQSGPAPATPM